MRFQLIGAEKELFGAIKELSGRFGFELAADGVPTTIEEGCPRLKWTYRGGILKIRTEKRVQAFYALKEFSDVFSNALPDDGYEREDKRRFTDLSYMLDCSRNAVPLTDTAEELVRHLAVLGYDTLMLYTEDTFTVKEQPYFGYLRNPFTKDDIGRIDAYCRIFGIELVPCIQTLAHFNSLVRHYAMDYLFDLNDILLVGEESTYRFIENLVSACAEYFTSRRINIGMDEAYMLGRGRYMDKHGARPRFEIMAEHLSRVTEICKKYGFRPMMWSDMFFSLTMSAQYGAEGMLPEETKKSIPRDVELVYWDYCSTSRAHYDEMLKKHRAFDNSIAFAGGAWKWLGYTPDNRYSFVSCGEAAKACLDNGVDKFIVTGWGDNGGECSVFATLPALLYCSRMNYGAFETDDAFKKSFLSFAGMPFDDFMTIDLANRVTRHDDAEEKNSANKYLLFNDVLLGTLDTIVEAGQGKLYEEHAQRLARAMEKAGKWRYLFETQYRLCRVLAVKAELGVKLRAAYQSGSREALAVRLNDLKRLPAEIERFYRALRAQWERENRANGFDVQDIRIGALKQRVWAAVRKVREYLNGKRENVPELEERLLCFMGHGENYEKDFDQCEYRWRRMTSVNVNE